MKLVWCPEMASQAYIDAVRVLADREDRVGSAEVAELVSAMAGGWNAQLVVEAPDVLAAAASSSSSSSRSPAAATSLALAAAARRTGGRYACVLPDAGSAAAHAGACSQHQEGAAAAASSSPSPATTVVVGEADEAMRRLEGVDLLVVDARRRDAADVLRAARPGPRGMVVVRHGDARRRGATALAAASMAAGTRVVRSVYLPIGKGVEVLHVGVGKGPSLQSRAAGRAAGRWIRHVNHDTGEEHVFRRQ